MTLSEFRDQFPEFINVADAQVSAFLASAATRIHADTFGDSYDIAHGYLAAHMLSVSPLLNTAKLEKSGKDKDQVVTTYLLEFRTIHKERVPTPIVAC